MLDWEEEQKQQSPKITSLPDDEKQRIIGGGQLLRERIDQLEERGEKAVQSVLNGEELIDPYTYDDKYWAFAATIITIFLLVGGRYSLLQNFTTVLVVLFTFITIGNFVSLQMTQEWHISSAEIIRGLSFGFPMSRDGINPLVTALATFGIIGVGASELIAYPYWCLEKGYAAHVGPRLQTDEWAHRAKGWLRVMYYDVFLSMIVYTVATVAFFLVGVSVLHRYGRDPGGMRMTSTLAEAYVPVFGEYARWLFLIGAIAVLYSTFLVANAGHTRVYTDLFKILGWIKRGDQKAHRKSIAILAVILPLTCLFLFCTNMNPVVAVLSAGIMQGILLPMLGIGALYFRFYQSDKRLKSSKLFDFFLILSCIGFFISGSWVVFVKGKEFLDMLF
ncbi:MAG: hypothetical protein JKY95_17905 [Planctomycetaceae bacterium]|nr:hypothetical protein [Planctomycetaceae bacterium]